MSSNMYTVKDYERKRNLSRARLQAGFIAMAAWSTCLNCDDWVAEKDGKPASCGRFGSCPPHDVLIVGCEFWNNIPF
jgi:hypothetical protein